MGAGTSRGSACHVVPSHCPSSCLSRSPRRFCLCYAEKLLPESYQKLPFIKHWLWARNGSKHFAVTSFKPHEMSVSRVPPSLHCLTFPETLALGAGAKLTRTGVLCVVRLYPQRGWWAQKKDGGLWCCSGGNSRPDPWASHFISLSLGFPCEVAQQQYAVLGVSMAMSVGGHMGVSSSVLSSQHGSHRKGRVGLGWISTSSGVTSVWIAGLRCSLPCSNLSLFLPLAGSSLTVKSPLPVFGVSRGRGATLPSPS